MRKSISLSLLIFTPNKTLYSDNLVRHISSFQSYAGPPPDNNVIQSLCSCFFKLLRYIRLMQRNIIEYCNISGNGKRSRGCRPWWGGSKKWWSRTHARGPPPPPSGSACRPAYNCPMESTDRMHTCSCGHLIRYDL